MTAMNYIAVRGQGDPNVEGGEYQASIGLLYGITFTIKMSKKGKIGKSAEFIKVRLKQGQNPQKRGSIAP